MNTDSGNLRTIQVANVVVGKRRRMLDFKKVQELAASIRECGLLTPITVASDMTLVAGHHRLEAMRVVGAAILPAYVVDMSPLQRELAEIDENLIRNDLTALERGEHLARRKEIYEEIHPETVHGGNHGGPGKPKRRDADLVAFTDDAAAKTGVSRTTIERDVKIANDIEEDVKDEIRDTPLADNKAALLEIARTPAAEQKQVAKEMLAGKRRPQPAKRVGTGDVVISRRRYNEHLGVLRELRDLSSVSVTVMKTATIKRMTVEILEWFERLDGSEQ